MGERILARNIKMRDLICRSLSVKYEANGIDQWMLFPDGKGLHIITESYVPADLLDMEGYSIKARKFANYPVYSEESRDDLLGWLNDAEKWKAFASGIDGATAKGGPTLEEFAGCWNMMNPCHKMELLHGTWWYLKNPTKLFIPDIENWEMCFGFWLASPNDTNRKQVHCVESVENKVFIYYYDKQIFGVRPLVTPPDETVLEYDEQEKIWLLVA